MGIDTLPVKMFGGGDAGLSDLGSHNLGDYGIGIGSASGAPMGQGAGRTLGAFSGRIGTIGESFGLPGLGNMAGTLGVPSAYQFLGGGTGETVGQGLGANLDVLVDEQGNIKRELFDQDKDGVISAEEQIILDSVRNQIDTTKALRDRPTTPPNSFQGQPLPEDKEPVQEPGEDRESFLERLLAWFTRTGGNRGGVGIQIPFPGFPGGGGGQGFPFPVPFPGRGGSGRNRPPSAEPNPPSTPPPSNGQTPPPGTGDPTPPPSQPPPSQPPIGGGGGSGPIDDSRRDDDTIITIPFPTFPGGGGETKPPDSGGTTVPENPKLKDLQAAASRGAISVYNDPNTFDRFAPSPLQTMDPRYRNISSFLPSGEITPYAMNYQRAPGAQYVNYPDAPPMQGGPLTQYATRSATGGGTTGGGTTQPGRGQPGTGQPSDGIDENRYENNIRAAYEELVPFPEPQSTAGVNAARKRRIERDNEQAIEEWERGFEAYKNAVGRFSRQGISGLLSGMGGGFADGGIATLADGGDVEYFPRKNGQIEGPGTETSDDIPAMLSDGEFVVNAKAVRGIGALQGADDSKKDQRLEGARAMYALQRMGEKAAGMS